MKPIKFVNQVFNCIKYSTVKSIDNRVSHYIKCVKVVKLTDYWVSHCLKNIKAKVSDNWFFFLIQSMHKQNQSITEFFIILSVQKHSLILVISHLNNTVIVTYIL